MRNLFQVSMQEVGNVVILSIHFKDQKDFFSTYQESFSVVLSNSCLCSIIDQNFFIVSLIVISVLMALDTLQFFLKELVGSNFSEAFWKCDEDEIIVSLHEEIFCICISKLDHTKLPKDLCIYNSKFVINCLVEDHVIHESVDLFTYCS